MADDQHEKRMRSLTIANEIRGRRKQARAEMSVAMAIELVEGPPAWAEGWRVAQVIQALPAIGITKQRRILSRCGISESAALGSLTARQRDALIGCLQERAAPASKRTLATLGARE